MQTKIDWISFTLKRVVNPDDNEPSTWYSVRDDLADFLGDLTDLLDQGKDWSWSSGRTPYKISKRRDDGGASIYFHPNLPHFLVEITGRGCDSLSDEPRAAEFLERILPRLTRIDVACDMLTDVRPTDFTARRELGRFKAHSEVVSESGETCYIGSRTSNRYARVYRYNAPHERAHLLRCEFVVKAEDARLTARAILDQGLLSVASSLGEKFGWQHPVWDVGEATPAELAAWRPDRREGKTLYWLADTVSSVLIRLHNEGVIDARQWFSEHVLSHISGEDN